MRSAIVNSRTDSYNAKALWSIYALFVFFLVMGCSNQHPSYTDSRCDSADKLLLEAARAKVSYEHYRSIYFNSDSTVAENEFQASLSHFRSLLAQLEKKKMAVVCCIDQRLAQNQPEMDTTYIKFSYLDPASSRIHECISVSKRDLYLSIKKHLLQGTTIQVCPFVTPWTVYRIIPVGSGENSTR